MMFRYVGDIVTSLTYLRTNHKYCFVHIVLLFLFLCTIKCLSLIIHNIISIVSDLLENIEKKKLLSNVQPLIYFVGFG